MSDGRQGLRRGQVAKVAVFLVLAAVLASVLTVLFLPLRAGTHTTETVKGLYAQPANSVQVAFFGTSAALSGFSPVELYDDKRISAYNCSSSVQPTIMSYYLLKEVLADQGESLKVAVIDPSVVLEGNEAAVSSVWADRIIMAMRPSLNKLQATLEVSESYETPLVEALVPLIRYHSRWSELSPGDFDLLEDDAESAYTRGQFVRFGTNQQEGNTLSATTENQGITAPVDGDAEKLKGLWDERSVEYLDKFVELCKENDVSPVFVKVPRKNWDDVSHDSLQLLADRYDVPFLDLSASREFEACGLTYAFDFVDAKHPNIHGANKISDYIGEYLEREFDLGSAPEAALPVLEADSRRYGQSKADGDLLHTANLADYLDLLDCDRYTVFITTGIDATGEHLPEAVRAKMGEMGLKNLAALTADKAYVSVLSGGEVVKARITDKDGDFAKMVGQFKSGKVAMDVPQMQQGAVIDKRFNVISSDPTEEDYSVFRYFSESSEEAENLSENGDGINFIVFDTQTCELLDTSCFDTETLARTTDLPK